MTNAEKYKFEIISHSANLDTVKDGQSRDVFFIYAEEANGSRLVYNQSFPGYKETATGVIDDSREQAKADASALIISIMKDSNTNLSEKNGWNKAQPREGSFASEDNWLIDFENERASMS